LQGFALSLRELAFPTLLDTIGGDGACDTEGLYAAISARDATPLIQPRESAANRPGTTPGAIRRNGTLDAIARDGRHEWKKHSGHHRRSSV
jgi:hypothetical protein